MNEILICGIEFEQPRYTYLGDAATRPELRGMQCDPVYRLNKKVEPVCVVGRSKAAVVDEQGRFHVVMRRFLRLNLGLPNH